MFRRMKKGVRAWNFYSIRRRQLTAEAIDPE
jgi:hypothetical protein